MQKRKGFTLIELLVVIAIIAILASILFPVFARARENARRSSCSSNLKQIALGVFQYTQDYDEKMPPYYVNLDGSSGYTAPAAAGGDRGWALILQPYLKSSQIFQCPSETTTPTSAQTEFGGDNYSDYWYNLMASGSSQAEFDSPALTVMLGDGGGGSSASYSYGGSCASSACTAAADAGKLATFSSGWATRHLDGQNFAFSDGHVKWLKGQNATTSASVYNGATGTSRGKATFRLRDGDATG